MQANPNDSTNISGQDAGMGNTGMGGGVDTGMGGGADTGGGDMLDKGVDYAERRAGHEQSHSTTEKISDGLRKGFQKVTGKDVPVKDKNYQ